MKKFISFPVLCALLVAAALIFVVSVRSCSTQYSAAPADAPKGQVTQPAPADGAGAHQ